MEGQPLLAQGGVTAHQGVVDHDEKVLAGGGLKAVQEARLPVHAVGEKTEARGGEASVRDASEAGGAPGPVLHEGVQGGGVAGEILILVEAAADGVRVSREADDAVSGLDGEELIEEMHRLEALVGSVIAEGEPVVAAVRDGAVEVPGDGVLRRGLEARGVLEIIGGKEALAAAVLLLRDLQEGAVGDVQREFVQPLEGQGLLRLIGGVLRRDDIDIGGLGDRPVRQGEAHGVGGVVAQGRRAGEGEDKVGPLAGGDAARERRLAAVVALHVDGGYVGGVIGDNARIVVRVGEAVRRGDAVVVDVIALDREDSLVLPRREDIYMGLQYGLVPDVLPDGG